MTDDASGDVRHWTRDTLVKVDDGEPVPLWALDMAAKAAQADHYDDWRGANNYLGNTPMRRCIIAHARTIAKHEKPPVDEAEMKRRQDAREAAAVTLRGIWSVKAIKDVLDGLDDCTNVRSAYIALCHRDGTTPIPVEEWGK